MIGIPCLQQNTYGITGGKDHGHAHCSHDEGAGHEVVECKVGLMNIKGCLACEYCHTKGEGKCIQKDDMDKVYPELATADVVVIASPVHYFALSGQLQSVIARFYAPGKP